MIKIFKKVVDYARKQEFKRFLMGYDYYYFTFYDVKVILDSREQELYDWLKEKCSSYQISDFNHVDHSINIIFALPEDAMLCKLTWGGK